MLRCFVLLMLLVQPAVARDITGMLQAPATPMTIGAEQHVQLIGGAGVVFDQRQPARVAQLAAPTPFKLTTDHTDAVVLRIAIHAGGVPVWVTDGIAIPAGDAAVDVGNVALVRPTLPGGMAPMVCGDVAISVSYTPDAARLRLTGSAVMLLAADAANPTRFSDGALPDTTLTRLGNRATLILKGTPLPACSPAMPPPLFPLRAHGVEPGWVLVADRTNMALTRADGVTAVAGAAQIRVMADGLALFAAPDMNLTLIDRACTDGRLPYPAEATLKMPGTTLQGCAGDAMAALAGAWNVDAIDGVLMPEDDVVTLHISASQVSGFAGCNRYTAAFHAAGTAALFGVPVASGISCVGPDMMMERSLLAALPRVTQMRVNANGDLEMRNADKVLLRAYR